MNEKVLIRVRTRIYGRRDPEMPLYYTGGEVGVGNEVALGEVTTAIHDKKMVDVREIIHHGQGSGFFLLVEDLEAEFDQKEQRRGIGHGRLRTAASY